MTFNVSISVSFSYHDYAYAIRLGIPNDIVQQQDRNWRHLEQILLMKLLKMNLKMNGWTGQNKNDIIKRHGG